MTTYAYNVKPTMDLGVDVIILEPEDEKTQLLDLIDKRLQTGDVLIISSLSVFGHDLRTMSHFWGRITKTIGADIVVNDLPFLDTRKSVWDVASEVTVSELGWDLLSYLGRISSAPVTKSALTSAETTSDRSDSSSSLTPERTTNRSPVITSNRSRSSGVHSSLRSERASVTSGGAARSLAQLAPKNAAPLLAPEAVPDKEEVNLELIPDTVASLDGKDATPLEDQGKIAVGGPQKTRASSQGKA